MRRKSVMSETEREIMEYLWTQKKGVALKDVWEYFNNEKHKNWKQPTVRAFLMRLKAKGHINIYIDIDTNKYIFLAKNSKEDFFHSYAQDFINKFYNGSLYEFMLAFTKDRKLTEDEAYQLKRLLAEKE